MTVVPNPTRGCRPYALIENAVTHADYRGRGFGKAVLQAALTHARSARCYKVMLLTGRNDEQITRCYRSLGFDPDSKNAFVAKP